eukprot:389152_1
MQVENDKEEADNNAVTEDESDNNNHNDRDEPHSEEEVEEEDSDDEGEEEEVEEEQEEEEEVMEVEEDEDDDSDDPEDHSSSSDQSEEDSDDGGEEEEVEEEQEEEEEVMEVEEDEDDDSDDPEDHSSSSSQSEDDGGEEEEVEEEQEEEEEVMEVEEDEDDDSDDPEDHSSSSDQSEDDMDDDDSDDDDNDDSMDGNIGHFADGRIPRIRLGGIQRHNGGNEIVLKFGGDNALSTRKGDRLGSAVDEWAATAPFPFANRLGEAGGLLAARKNRTRLKYRRKRYGLGVVGTALTGKAHGFDRKYAKMRNQSKLWRKKAKLRLKNRHGLSEEQANYELKDWKKDVKGWDTVSNDGIKCNLMIGAVDLFAVTQAAEPGLHAALGDWQRSSWSGILSSRLRSHGYLDGVKPFNINRKLENMARKDDKRKVNKGGNGGQSKRPKCERGDSCKNKNCNKYHSYGWMVKQGRIRKK